MKISSYFLTIDKNSNFIDKNDTNKTLLAEQYSLAKYGSYKDIEYFAKNIAKTVISEIIKPNSELRNIFEVAKANNEYVVLMTPGFRNVKASANIMFEIALPLINIQLSLLKLPVIANVKLPRLASPSENYASLSEEERKAMGEITDHILPDTNFYQAKGVHILYGDDILITGSSSDKARNDALSKGAKSFTSIYAIIMDKNISKNNPAIEEKLNRSAIIGILDNRAKEIFTQKDFIPVLRSLRLLLNKDNLSNLEDFINFIPINNILKIYIAYLNNESLENHKYKSSIEIITNYLIVNKQIHRDGNLLI